jgi:subtilisin-like proprotein convertase family protein
MQYQLVLVDQGDGRLLAQHNLVNEVFSGTVYTASPGANPQGDPRSLVSFDGDPTASPSGWVGTARKTIGNNAVAATDLNANNTVGTNETQPTADANGVFTFPYNAQQDAAGFKAAAVTNAFYLVNQYHDLTYKLGFTETAGNFQTSNFGKGGAQADEVQVDAQDGSGTDNANFATPPDGQKPRMQMFLFDLAHGTAQRQDGDFDASVIWHENTHGVSNRLVGGGSTTCLNNLQSGGMGEGWGDFMGGSFLGSAVVGAYVTGNATNGIRSAPMDNNPFTYNDIKNGTLAEVHDAGELWSSTLWSMRTAIGKAAAEQLVIAGLKLTPCNPTMINARDAIIQADANLNAGVNRCAIFGAFASKAMGSGASSPNDRSTTAIVTSTTVPADCGGTTPPAGTTRTFTSTDVPKSIPDNNATGVRSSIPVTQTGLTITKVLVNVGITHTFRGDLVIQVVAPNGQVATLSNRAGGSADNFTATNLDITSSFTAGSAASGTWQLFVRDLAAADVGTINSFSLAITSPN